MALWFKVDQTRMSVSEFHLNFTKFKLATK